MKKTWWIGLWVLSAGLVWATLPSPAQAGPEGSAICGTIDVDTRWTLAGSPYLVACSSEVAAGVVLTIDPGVVVQFDRTDLVMYGSLQAVGTAGHRITFTSSQASPLPGDWGHLKFVGANQSSQLQYVVVQYGGLYWGNEIALEAGTLAVRDSVVRFSMGVGMEAWVMPTLTGTAFENNGAAPLRLLFGAGARQPGEIAGNQGTGNGVDGIYVGGTFDADVTLGENPGMAYYTDHEALGVAAGYTLTLLPGAVLKMDGTRLLVSGSLRAEGEDGSPVVLTSLQDDAYGGDTNGDGNASQPEPGDWGDLTIDSKGGGWRPSYVSYLPMFINQTKGAGSPPPSPCVGAPSRGHPRTTGESLPSSFGSLYLDHAIVRYGGQDLANVDVFESPVSILNSTIEHSATRGIYAEDTSPELRNSTIRDNATMGVWIYGLDVPVGPVLVDNSFMDNGTFAAYLLFWGDCHPTTEIHGNSGSGNGMVNGIFLEGYVDTPSGCRLQPNPQFPYVLWAIEVHNNGRLELEPGVECKFVAPELDRGTGTLIISGTLEALGTAESPVAFTSFWDDEIGGDTDGTAALPAPGDWWGIVAGDGAHVSLDHALLRYGGLAGANLWSADADLSLTNSEVAFSSGKGLAVRFTTSGRTLLIGNNQFLGNEGYAASLVSTAPALTGLSFAGNIGSGNSIDAILLDAALGATTLKVNATLPYMIQSLAVPDGQTMAIEPGVVFKADREFTGGGGLLTVEGVLQVQGTEASPVYFTSLHDDSVGGDTDNASVPPALGDWYGIAVQGAGQAVMSHAVIHYAGWGGSSLFFAGSSLQMADAEVAFSADKGLQVQKEDSASVIVSNSIFEENEGYAVSIRSADPTLGGFEFSGNQGANNGLNAIFVDGTLSSVVLKANAELPYVFQSLVVGAGQTVTVKPGAVFKAMPRDPGSLGLLSVVGSLQVAGSDADPVSFTSVRDDSVGGDTDGLSAPPLPGDWAGILVQHGGEVRLTFSSVAYAGMNDAALYNFGRLEIGNSLVAFGAHHGIVNGPGGELTLEDSIVRNHAQTGVKNAGTGFLARNDIMNNLEYGVYSYTQGYVLVAEHNFWGGAAGPAWDGIQNCDPLPQGGGDKVSCATVDYRPFALVPYH